ncbi:MAG: hypothetical protein RJA70_4381 [Pseudomonadota bacterium]
MDLVLQRLVVHLPSAAWKQRHDEGVHRRRPTEVFCSGDSCRNNTRGWPTRTVPVPKNGKRKDFSFYATNDRAMADDLCGGRAKRSQGPSLPRSRLRVGSGSAQISLRGAQVGG